MRMYACWVCACVHASMRIYVGACVRACVRVCIFVSKHNVMFTCGNGSVTLIEPTHECITNVEYNCAPVV